MSGPLPGSWQSRVWSALLVLVAVAVGARIVWEVLHPLLGGLLVLVVLVGLFGLLIGRRRR